MKKRYIAWILWAAVLVWMAVIFRLSAQDAAASSELSARTIRVIAAVVHPSFNRLPEEQRLNVIANFQHLVRKTAHVTAYLILGVLCLSALFQHPLRLKTRVISALVISIGYAATDEFHQLFVQGRGSQITDVGIDSCGALAGVLLALLVHHLWLRRKKIG